MFQRCIQLGPEHFRSVTFSDAQAASRRVAGGEPLLMMELEKEAFPAGLGKLVGVLIESPGWLGPGVRHLTRGTLKEYTHLHRCAS